jgi:amino acid adenylation domain-containing protein/non-ribosomal peptide synthase protein (TIGR01720 family)
VEQTHYDLSVGISLFDEVDIRFIYDSSIFSDDMAAALANRFMSIINFILEQPGKCIYEIDILSKEEKRQLLIDFNDTAADFPLGKTLHRLFEEQVKRTPDHTALVGGKMHLSYGELNKKSHQLVCLLRKRGIRPETIVGIMMERSIEMVIGMLGILKAGGAYLPIDPNYPEERINYMLADSNAKILLAAPDLTSLPVPSFSTLTSTSTCRVSSTNPAYIIYTSGSTGMPKGVVVEHYSAVNVVTWFIRNYNLGNNTHILQMSEYTFDPSVNQVFGTLLCGGTLYLIGKEQLFDVRFLREFIKDRQIYILNSVPSFLMELLGGGPRLESVKAVLSGGERLPEPVKDAIISRGYELYNQYGPTETTIDALTGKCSTGRVILGKPIANARCYVLNSVGQLVPPGVPGELYIGGAGVARGYLNNPELTAQKFDRDGYHRSYRSYKSYVLYKTGDLARWLSDGNIEYIGRIDHQVKIRGFRIEPGEIENRLLSCPGVKEAVVIAKESKQGDKYLCAYIVGENLVKTDVKEYLSGKLPAYMIPAHIMPMEKIPLTANGKIDRAALPEPGYDVQSHDKRYAAPGNRTEEKLVEVWEKVLGFERIGIDDNFFQLGGDSIKAIQVSARLLKYNLELKINDLFLYPVIRELGKYVKKRESGRNSFQGIVEGKVPLTPIQHWLFESGFTGIHHFNHSVLLQCNDEKGLEEAILQKVFSKLVEHHDALRMVYGFEETGVFQQCRGLEGKLFDLEVADVTEGEIDKEIENHARKIQQSIDLTTGPLLKSILFKTYRGDYLLIVIHHLVVDGVSWRILMEDLVTCYKQLEAGNKLELPEKTDSFQYWARRLTQYGAAESNESEYWKGVEKTGIKELPRDHVIEDSRKKQKYTAAIDITLDEEQTERLLKQVNQAYNTEINDILLTALGMAVNRWGGIEKVLVNLEGHGREGIIPGIDISRTVGWFTTQYPVVLDMAKSQDVSYAVRSVKETLRRIPHKGIGYGILKYLTPREKHECTFKLKPGISFNYLGHFMQDNDGAFFKLSGINTGGSVHPGMHRKHAVDIVGMLSEGKIRFSFLYNKYEYDKDHMENLAKDFHSHLSAIIRHCSARRKPMATPYDLGSGISLEELEQITGFAAANIDKDVEIQHIHPLSPMQSGMLYHWLKDQRDHAYFEQVVLKIDGEIHGQQLENSVNRLVERHDILRTLFFYDGLEHPLQIVLKERKPVLYYEDISHLSEAEGKLHLEKFKEKDKERGFDLTVDRLMRFSLFRTGPGLYRLVWSFHHIIMDGWCMGILFKELLEVYRRLIDGKPVQMEPAPSYGSYLEWLDRQDKAPALNYWRTYLSGYEQQASLPGVIKGAVEDNRGTYKTGNHCFVMDEDLMNALNKVAAEKGVTLHTIFQTAWGILLQRFNNTEDMVFGSVVSGRPPDLENVEQIVGLFINTLPVRIRLKGEQSFLQLALRVQKESVLSQSFQHVPLVEVQALTPLSRGLINHIMVYENYPLHEELSRMGVQHDCGFSVTDVEVFEQTNYDFNIALAPGRPLR